MLKPAFKEIQSTSISLKKVGIFEGSCSGTGDEGVN